MGHHTKEKGDLAVLKVMSALGEQGFLILNPITEHAPFDLVVYKEGSFKTVQVKYKAAKESVLHVNLRSCWSDKAGTHSNPFNRDEVDVVAVYCPETNTCYFLSSKECSESINLRLDHPKNNQVKKVRLAKDYLWVP